MVLIGGVRVLLLVEWSEDEVILGASMMWLSCQEWEDWVELRATVAGGKFKMDVSGVGDGMKWAANGMMCLNSSCLRAAGFVLLWDFSKLSVPFVSAFFICVVWRYAHKLLVESARSEPGRAGLRAAL